MGNVISAGLGQVNSAAGFTIDYCTSCIMPGGQHKPWPLICARLSEGLISLCRVYLHVCPVTEHMPQYSIDSIDYVVKADQMCILPISHRQAAH